MTFRYGGEIDFGRNVSDALALEISNAELWRVGTAETGELRYLHTQPKIRPLLLPVKVPKMARHKAVRVKVEVSPGTYVVSVSALMKERNARYNFRVVVE